MTFTGLIGSDFSFGGGYHSDLHALWIHPGNPEHLLLGTDGGVYESFDRGGHWRLVKSLPVSQFYHVSYDMEWPYNVYGGLQDNGSWMGPSRTSSGIAGRHWKNIGGGDGFWAFVNPTDPDYTYVQYQGGNIQRSRKSTGETRDIRPFPKEGEPKYRFNWNTAVHHSRKDRGTMYVGAQLLFRPVLRFTATNVKYALLECFTSPVSKSSTSTLTPTSIDVLKALLTDAFSVTMLPSLIGWWN